MANIPVEKTSRRSDSLDPPFDKVKEEIEEVFHKNKVEPIGYYVAVAMTEKSTERVNRLKTIIFGNNRSNELAVHIQLVELLMGLAKRAMKNLFDSLYRRDGK